jgi:hypothetical protein
MRSLLYVTTALIVMAVGFWAYRENYATQAALREVRALQTDIADLRQALALQRAEWAYLNRPDRLRELATVNFDRLGLLPLEPGQFATVAEIAYPPPPSPLLTDTTMVTNQPGTDPQDGEPFP